MISMATHYGLEGPGIKQIPFAARSSVPAQTNPEAQPPKRVSGFGGLVVGMLASGNQDRGFKPS
jgi:hypothetical protein